MSWAALFERAEAYAVEEAAVAEALAERRGDDDPDGADAETG